MANNKDRSRRLSNVLSNRKSVVAEPRQIAKVGRNERCPCGSGKKYKDCHLSEGETYLNKLALDEERERLRQLRQQLKADGVPWYRRLFARV